MIFQEPMTSLNPVLSVGAQIGEALRLRGIQGTSLNKRVLSLLDSVGIADPQRVITAYPHQLSGGMAQRVIIAMAMVARPEVILADDATLGLDATVQVQVLDLLVERCRQLGLSIVLITHDLGIVAHYCDRVAVMRSGRIVELKPVQRFLAKPEERYSVELLESAKARPVPRGTESPAEVAQAQGDPVAAPLLEVQNLFKLFPISGTREVVRAVDDVSFELRKGETLGLVGESGSGKSVTAFSIIRLVQEPGRIESGRIVFQGKDLLALPEEDMRQVRGAGIGFVFQEPMAALNPVMKIGAHIAEALLVHGLASRRDARGCVRTISCPSPSGRFQGRSWRAGWATSRSIPKPSWPDPARSWTRRSAGWNSGRASWAAS